MKTSWKKQTICNWRWWVCFPYLISLVIFALVFLLPLKVVGVMLKKVGEFLINSYYVLDGIMQITFKTRLVIKWVIEKYD